MSTSTRRGLLGGAAVLTAAPVVSTRAATRQPDAELLRLGDALKAAWIAENAAYAAAADIDADDALENLRAEKAMGRSSKLVRQIEALRATTSAGVLVKVQALCWCRANKPFEDGDFKPYPGDWSPATETRVLTGLLNDLIALEGGVA